jgi:calcineurin-like phosphoesterase family protein
MCVRVGNQQRHGVMTARVQTDAVRSLRHQCRDLHLSTYPYLSKDRDSSYYHHVRTNNELMELIHAHNHLISCSLRTVAPYLSVRVYLVGCMSPNQACWMQPSVVW